MKRILFSVLAVFLAVGALMATEADSLFLTRVNSVKAGDRLIFERNGAVLTMFASSPLPATTNWQTTGLTGTEEYVWTLRSVGEEFLICGQYDLYLLNLSNGELKCGGLLNGTTYWTFAFAEDSTATISTSANRFIGETSAYSYQYKTYAKSSLASYGHDFSVWRLDRIPDEDPTGIEEIDSSSLQGGDRGRLILHSGQLLITRDGKTFNVLGTRIR